MHRGPALALIATLPLLAPALAAAPASAPCAFLTPAPGADIATLPLDFSCPAAIRPGANSNMCTLNFVVTDSVDLYIGAAGHCSFPGERLRVAGIAGEVGTVVHHRNEFPARDWAFVRIDPEDRARVDPAMCRWAGPSSSPLGAARGPLPGEALLHYGHGVALGSMEPTRGRAGVAAATVFGPTTFAFVGSVSGGDSGSPVRIATGEAAGIAVAAVAPGYQPTYVIGMRFDAAMDDLASALGRPVTLVEAAPLPPLPL